MRAYQPCHEAFTRYCSAIAYGKMDSEDLMQDVLLKAYQRFDQVEQKQDLLFYLIRSAKNKLISQWRRKKFSGEYIERQALRLQSQGCSPETLTDIGHLYEAMQALKESTREALILFEVSGFSMKEIAEIQSCKEPAVRTRISRGRKQLRDILEGHDHPGANRDRWKQALSYCL